MKALAFPSRPEPLEARIAPATLYALTTSGAILVFDSATPGTIADTITVTGLGTNETLVGLDFRPSGGELLASTATTGSANNSVAKTYLIDPDSGAATLIGATAAALAGWGDVAGGFDFNPTVDRIRVVNVSNENARLNPDNGTLAGNDTDLTFTAPTTGPIIGVAYDRNFVHGVTTETTLYGIDRGANRLVVIGGLNGSPGPNGGATTNIGVLGVTLDPAFDAGFDIENKTGTAFAALRDDNTNVTGLYTIDLATGSASFVGAIGSNPNVRSLSATMPTVTKVNATTATYTDADGDIVTVKTTKGDLANATVLLNASADGTGQLKLIDFNGDLTFNTTGLKITVKKAGLGDGFANIGFIDATGIDLGAVSIPGDLGTIDAGDATTATAGVKSLAVQSIGLFGTATGVLGQSSNVVGALGKLTVKTDVKEVFIDVTGGADGKIGSLMIGGSLIGGAAANSGRIAGTGDFGTVKIGRDIVGGSGGISGVLEIDGDVRSLTLGGSVLGGSGTASGLIQVGGDISQLKIGRDVLGGSAASSGQVFATGKLVAGTIGGDVRGGTGSSSGGVLPGAGIDRLTLGGSLLGGTGGGSGTIAASGGDFGTIKIAGSVVGGTGSSSASISASGMLRSLSIGGNFEGGSIPAAATGNLSSSGKIDAKHIGSVFIGGDMLAGRDDNATFKLDSGGVILALDDIGSVTIRGDLAGRTGTGGTTAALIIARGQATPGATTDVAIGSLTVGGRVELANILAGYISGLTAANPDAQIGKVTVSGDWVASNLVAGVQDDATTALNVFFGDADDQVIAGGAAAIVSRIGAIVIKGQVAGTALASDFFGFVAQQIGSFTAAKSKLPLTTNLDAPFRLAFPTFDVAVREFA